MRKAFICPTKYVQGEDELLNLGYFVSTYGKTALLIAHPDDIARVQDKLDKTAEKFGVKFVTSSFTCPCMYSKYRSKSIFSSLYAGLFRIGCCLSPYLGKSG